MKSGYTLLFFSGAKKLKVPETHCDDSNMKSQHVWKSKKSHSEQLGFNFFFFQNKAETHQNDRPIIVSHEKDYVALTLTPKPNH